MAWSRCSDWTIPLAFVSITLGGSCFRLIEFMTQTWDSPLPQTIPVHKIILLGLTGAYLNIVAFGFEYGGGNHEFELPLVNWLRDRSLYPNDPIREAFTRFPTIFWPVVARLSDWMSTEKVLFLFFVLTKVFFFLALAFLLKSRVRDIWLSACIIFSVALSPPLNDLTPLGASDILNAVQTHSSLSIALLLWAAVCLLEERWIAAALICALNMYLSAPYSIYMLFAFAVFAAMDWRRNRKSVLAAGTLGAVISIPWFLFSSGVSYRGYPKGYVEALVAFYPFHFTLHGHEVFDFFTMAGLVATAGLMIWVVRASGHHPEIRLEVLTFSFLLPIVAGILLSVIHLTPTIARLQLLRSDSFLVLFSVLLIQIYGAKLIESPVRAPATSYLLGFSALLLPLSDTFALIWWDLPMILFWADQKDRFERMVQAAARPISCRIFICIAIVVCSIYAWTIHEDESMVMILWLFSLLGCLLVFPRRPALSPTRVRGITLILAAASCVLMAVYEVPKVSSIWNPTVAPTFLEADWRSVQEWAKINTAKDAQFLVPTYPCGFRVFSQRSSWGEWKDGQAAYHYPPFADVFRERMLLVGYSWQEWKGSKSITENYRHLTWDRLLALARENRLSYIIQFRDVAYLPVPVFANQHYAVYKVEY